MREYLTFIAAHPRFLAFGLLAALFSSFGQTFFISLFGGELRGDFNLSHAQVGALYSGATLASGVALIWLGRVVDRVDLRGYTLVVCLAAAAACLLMGLAPTTAILAVAFFALRLTGQGLLSHLSVVAMARRFAAQRGRAVSLAALGHPAGEAVFPFLAVSLIAALGWRETWLVLGGALLVCMAPLMLWLLRGQQVAPPRPGRTRAASGDGGVLAGRSMSQVLRDPLFYPLIFAMLVPSFVVTGLFFHQVALAAAKGWSLSWLAACFVGFAASQTAASLGTGALVDRFGSVRLLPVYLLPLGLGTAVLAIFGQPLAAAAYLVLAGLTAGASFTMLGALWAELYGVAHIGAIRGVVHALMTFSTAAAPVLFGWLLDAGVGFEALALGCTGYAVGGAALLVLVCPKAAARIARNQPQTGQAAP